MLSIFDNVKLLRIIVKLFSLMNKIKLYFDKTLSLRIILLNTNLT